MSRWSQRSVCLEKKSTEEGGWNTRHMQTLHLDKIHFIQFVLRRLQLKSKSSSAFIRSCNTWHCKADIQKVRVNICWSFAKQKTCPPRHQLCQLGNWGWNPEGQSRPPRAQPHASAVQKEKYKWSTTWRFLWLPTRHRVGAQLLWQMLGEQQLNLFLWKIPWLHPCLLWFQSGLYKKVNLSCQVPATAGSFCTTFHSPRSVTFGGLILQGQNACLMDGWMAIVGLSLLQKPCLA